MTKGYEIALERFRTASAVWRNIQAQYHAEQIDDTAFLAARKTFAVAQAVMDREEFLENVYEPTD